MNDLMIFTVVRCQIIFRNSFVIGLTIRDFCLQYDLSEAIYKDDSMPSTDYLKQWSQIGQADADDRVDLYVAFGYDEKDHSCDPSSPNWTGSGCSFTTGLAYVGGACTDEIKNSMNEWSDSPAKTGLVSVMFIFKFLARNSYFE